MLHVSSLSSPSQLLLPASPSPPFALHRAFFYDSFPPSGALVEIIVISRLAGTPAGVSFYLVLPLLSENFSPFFLSFFPRNTAPLPPLSDSIRRFSPAWLQMCPLRVPLAAPTMLLSDGRSLLISLPAVLTHTLRAGLPTRKEGGNSSLSGPPTHYRSGPPLCRYPLFRIAARSPPPHPSEPLSFSPFLFLVREILNCIAPNSSVPFARSAGNWDVLSSFSPPLLCSLTKGDGLLFRRGRFLSSFVFHELTFHAPHQ